MKAALKALLLIGVLTAFCCGRVSGEEGEGLAEKVAQAAEAQEYREDAPEKVVSSIIAGAPPAVLNAGTGDVSTTGACSADVDTFCPDITPGAGRIAECLMGTIKGSKSGVGKPEVSQDCVEELDQFKMDRATNINKDLSLATACKGDVEKFCGNDELYPETGAVLTCLREIKSELSSSCADEVFRTQLEAADDYRDDAMLHELCEPDAASLCPDVKPGNGKVQECLRDHRSQLSWDCQEELFRKEVEDADDIRLSTKLFKACLQDKRRFCPDVKPGANRAKECLEDSREETGFSEDCRSELEAMMARRAVDFRLDAKLRELCSQDIEEVCGYEKESMDSIAGYDARVSSCLMDYRDEILNPQCQSYVHKLIEEASSDVRLNVPLADACFEDRENFCSDVPPGSARVIRCLQDSREQLGFECRATLFDMEVRMSESLDFQYPMKKACNSELKRFCSDVAPGNALQIRCLQGRIESPDMSLACKEEVQKQEQRQNEDYRLNFRLHRACEVDVNELCSDVCSPFQGQACGGTVLRCLTDNREKIQDEACKHEVFYFIKMEVSDFRNDVLLAEACRDDVSRFCGDVEGGNGRVHTCLRKNREQLSQKCKDEERKLNIIQSENIDLRPRLKMLCRGERAVFCNSVAPGKGRVVRCLQESLAKPGFSEGCRSELDRRQALRMTDYRLDFGVAKECKDDIMGICKQAKEAANGSNSAVLKCLTSKYAELSSQGCQGEVARAVRMAIWSFSPNKLLTKACDVSVASVCDSLPKTPKWGAVGQCLSSNIESLPAECKVLVEIGAPKDARADFLSTFTMASLHSQLRSTEKTLGFNRGTLVQRKRGVRSVTITGWAALLGMFALVVVLLGSMYSLYHQHRYGRLPDVDQASGPMVIKGGSK
mmetsp:Transcript_18814/g.52452  ORF Transcript_18814/g.52452 Transcript_18814/m.52452 type:complete len:892 (-) Transcript_18814:83-2758(-)|eukprot:CAMPEP_0117673726 /NCGR_PEP_ID=MMETSP0804-20121206/14632_1 /TAXON_ID=1074897 /ORGANISM="Tetraselmis astigmatica, Strain CCMP880" /LENGTH=891 /DNA_ID=CAMNT_0005482495 /DNA_START=194 /DNA_END=2869 /DNA_ORIENTATION=-